MRYSVSFIASLLIGSAVWANDDFEKNIRPLLIEHCIQCHGPKKQSGGLRLDSKSSLLKGGDTGPAAILHKPTESLLVKAVEYSGELKMPPKGKLKDEQIRHLNEWIRLGANWPESAISSESGGPAKPLINDEHRRWWAYQPLKAVTPPKVQNEAWIRSEIDRFILAKLETNQLKPARTADKRTLIRRVTHDLTGLPPTVDEINAFIRDDSPEAFAKVIDRLLASSAYGERWGRHWLDVVRYADTAGENSDHPAPHAWRYRNWVIDAFNQDKPYDQMIREQISGDLIAKKAPVERYASLVTATGFLAVARRFEHDTDKAMHLTYEDVIDTIGRAFLGQSFGCARCHDHKYDPISTKDYYALFGILQSTRFPFPGCEPKQLPRDLVPLVPPTVWAKTVEPFQKQLGAIDAELVKIGEEIASRGRTIKSNQASSIKLLAKGQIPDGGQQTIRGVDGKPLEAVMVKTGQVIQLSILPLMNHGADTTQIDWEITEVGGKQRKWNLAKDTTQSQLAANPHPSYASDSNPWWFLDTQDGLKILPEHFRDLMGKPGLNGWRNGDTPSVFVNSTDKPISVWTTLAPRSFFTHPGPKGPVAIAWASPIDGKVTITGRIVDAHPTGPDGVGWTLEQVNVDLKAELSMLTALAAKQGTLTKQKSELLAKAPQQEVAYAVTDRSISNARVQLRGNPEKLGAEVPRRWLEFWGGDIVENTTESGRIELGNWLSDQKNPLTARVMVNRIWLNHFGKGLVPTPNDFGTRGQRPTHPELLDWLANQFIQDGWSIKKLHRRILLSATYQQAVETHPAANEKDPTNSLYWRGERRRLSAEEIRDSLLVVSGRLDRTPDGPHPFPPESKWAYTQHVPFSEVYETEKRSVYLISLRNRRHPFLGLFDGADPNASTGQRQTTTVPTQALYWMNDPFVHRQADFLTERLLTVPESNRLDELFRILFQRLPTDTEREKTSRFILKYVAEIKDAPKSDQPKIVWSALVRVLLASNEFLYIE